MDSDDDQHWTIPKLRRLLTRDERQVCEVIHAGAASPLEIATSLDLTLLEVEALMESASEKLDASIEMDEAASSHISDTTH